MCLDAMTWAVRLRGISPTEKLVLVILANRADEREWRCWPSQNLLAEEAALSRQCVNRVLASLREKGLLAWEGQTRGDGSNSSNLYTLNPVLGDTPVFEEDMGGRPGLHQETDRLNGYREIKHDTRTHAREVAQQMLSIWIQECGHIHKPEGLQRDRVTKLKARFEDSFGRDINEWVEYCRRIAQAPHLRGENDRGWRATLDWVLEPRNLRKVREGNYDEREPANSPGASGIAAGYGSRRRGEAASPLFTALGRLQSAREGGGPDDA